MPKKGFLIGNRLVTISALLLTVFGSFMIVSAEMGNDVGDVNYLTEIVKKQILYVFIAILAYFLIINIILKLNINIFKLRIGFYWIFYGVILISLLACRFMGATNGAYAWIRIGNFSVQPSEFAKVFMIVFAAKLFTSGHKDNLKVYKMYILHALVYFVIIAFIQHDLGSAVVLFLICYCILLIPTYKEVMKIQMWLTIFVFVGIALVFILLSPPVTNWMKQHSDNYMFGRFLAAADPFLYRYDSGYHIIMSLVSFGSGNIFGLGYGNSIHKYMNFPNPSNDFILPVIVEELGIFGFLTIVVGYGVMLAPLIYYSSKSESISNKIICLGTFLYFVLHFILNVGGVSGIIPLTGVPLLLISSGGSSLAAGLMALAFGQTEITR